MKQFDSSLLHDKLKEYFGFSSFKGNQEAVIRNVLEGIMLSFLMLLSSTSYNLNISVWPKC